jgi:hypothetical protein
MIRRILSVDHELVILLTLKAILEMNGFEVFTGASSLKPSRRGAMPVNPGFKCGRKCNGSDLRPAR